MQLNIQVNRAQLTDTLLMPRNVIHVDGRATGKSWMHGKHIDSCVRKMPRSVCGMVFKTYGMGYTGTFQSMLAALEKFGYVRDGNYVVNKKPPAGFLTSYSPVEKYENTISFANGTKFVMFSQAEKGSMRGANCDSLMADEIINLDEEQLKKESIPTNRGNLEHFGKGAHHSSHLHHGLFFTTSMPYTKNGRWILKYGDYYEKEYGIRLFDIWNKVVSMQLQLLDCENAKEFAQCWNEIENLRSQIVPRVSSDGTLFVMSNAFDNIGNVGLKYIRDMRKSLTDVEFLTEGMNYYINKVEGCFYSINTEKQVYYNALDDSEVMLRAGADGFSGTATWYDDPALQRDYDPEAPLEIAPDWGAQISLFVMCQTRHHDIMFTRQGAIPILEKGARDYVFQIDEFFCKPNGTKNALINELCDKICTRYKNHRNKVIYYYRDRYGDTRNPNVVDSRSYNEQAVARLKENGWKVITKVHKGNEPNMSKKYLLWANILEEKEDYPVRFRINGQRCKYTLISMNNAQVIQVGNKFEKDKSSEKSKSGVLPEEATHFSDAIDKLIYTKYEDGYKADKGARLPSNV